ncbi:MAG TPA: LCP family protein [Candidatus Dormibacteraeota bacterium]|nr:LCP family protein [Candidatus Dormibacteraeota bacterium]
MPNEAALRALGSSGEADPGPVANEDGLRSLGLEVERAGRTQPRRGGRPHPHRRRRRRVKWALGIVGAVVLLVVVAVLGDAWYLNHRIHRISVAGLADQPKRGADVGTVNILMVGSTSRCALKVQSLAYGLCSQGVTGVNSDVIMILHLNPVTHAVSILSIPRDLFVPNARAEGANKIDAALAEGPTQLVRAVEQDFGIPIQHYVELNFDSFAGVVDALGGISMYFPEPVYDAYSGLNIRTTGCVHLNGTQALQVVRARHLQYKGPTVTTNYAPDWPMEAQSDLARIRRDHEFLRVLASAVQKRGLGNPVADQQLVSSVVGQLQADSSFSASEMLSLVLAFHSVNVGQAPQVTLPVAVDQFGNYYYKGGDYGDIEFPSQPLDAQVVDQFLGLKSSDDTFNGGPLPPPSSVPVSVLNGTGATNQATDTAQALTALGFHVGTIGDTPSVATQSETVVYYSARTPKLEAAAQTVAHALSGAVIMAVNPAMVSTGAQVTVVTGTDFAVNSPAPPATTPAGGAGSKSTTTVPPTTPTTTSTTAGNGAFSPPSPAVESLRPWDPRSCTPSGGEGP